MKVLVTGHNGFIGPILVRRLVEAGHKVIGFDTDYFKDCSFYKYLPIENQIIKDIRKLEAKDLDGVEAVIHLAALSNDLMGEFDPAITDDINYKATMLLANLAKKQGIDRFIYSSSCSIYGRSDQKSITEEVPMDPITAYAKSKRDCEVSLATLADKNFCPVYMRNATAYGVSPFLRTDLVVNNLVAWAVTSGKICIMSDGTPWRPIAHIDDIAQAMVCALTAPRENIYNQAFNIGRNEDNYQIRDIASMVKNVTTNTDVTYTNEHGGDSRSYNVNFDKVLKHMPSFRPSWNLEKGVVELYEAYHKHGMTTELFTGKSFTRMKQLRWLLDNNKIDQHFYRKDI